MFVAGVSILSALPHGHSMDTLSNSLLRWKTALLKKGARTEPPPGAHRQHVISHVANVGAFFPRPLLGVGIDITGALL